MSFVRHKGFTLIEVLISLAILVSAIALGQLALRQYIDTTQRLEQKSQAANIALLAKNHVDLHLSSQNLSGEYRLSGFTAHWHGEVLDRFQEGFWDFEMGQVAQGAGIFYLVGVTVEIRNISGRPLHTFKFRRLIGENAESSFQEAQ
ncbi:type II secretion system protein [Aliiglaciecola sp. CAU 1673]|uniref:type II secretion system protein n=1 Tax=Aliiglaciecola sp. CAU 1673 TaxID=3032595 RepID=UPI0023DB28EB|nr:type II secretion system protein [Aliiglaciecola sp. CAU 1673]MDF2177511.1 type II secretion system protein [Aliiglaciecola sp. CAU 1673]